jgi:hypothetical protein
MCGANLASNKKNDAGTTPSKGASGTNLVSKFSESKSTLI